MTQNADLAILEKVEAQQALHQLNAQFARAFDRMDRCQMVSLWTQDAEVDWGKHQGDAKAFVVESTAPDNTLERTFSSISNEYFEIDGNTARGEVYIINISTIISDDKKEDRLIGGRFLDHYRKEQGEWKISKRSFVHDWNMNLPTTAVLDEGLFALFRLRGERDQSDPVYTLFGA